MSQDFSKGEEYVKSNFVWTEEMEIIASKLREINKTLNGRVISPFADKLLS